MYSGKEIRDILHNHVVEVEFKKKDGSTRIMICTLMDKFLPSKAELIAQDGRIDEVVTVWDLECDGWRSFRVDSIISLEYESVED